MGLSAGLIVLAILGGAALVRAWAARRVRGGDRRLAPTLLLSTLLIVLVLAGVGVWLAVRSLLLGIPATVGALLLGGAWLRVSLDTVRFGDPAPRGRDRMDDLADRMDRTYRSLTATLLAFGFAGAILIVVYLFGRGRF